MWVISPVWGQEASPRADANTETSLPKTQEESKALTESSGSESIEPSQEQAPVVLTKAPELLNFVDATRSLIHI